MFRRPRSAALALGSVIAASAAWPAAAWQPLPVANDPLVRMPGTQPNAGVTLSGANGCANCHGNFANAPADGWKGSMKAQAARDPLFWAATAVAAQDSIWAHGRPNGADLCFRCHAPGGWFAGRADPPNGSFLNGGDFDGVSCDACHKLYDPFFEDTFAGTREGNDWLGYWDETNLSTKPSNTRAQATLTADRQAASSLTFFNGGPLYNPTTHKPNAAGYTDHGGGQLFAAATGGRRASFSDDKATHATLYSRFHKSRHLCGSCHDASNPALVNAPFANTPPGNGTTVLPSEQQPAYAYGHVERTYSEFLLSSYGVGAGSAGLGPFAPGTLDTSRPGDLVATCQDCHMADVVGKGANTNSPPTRPTESVEHPKSGLPRHELAGGNVWIPLVLASTVSTSPNFDSVNLNLLDQGPATLTLDLLAGTPLDPAALIQGASRAQAMLESAASIAAANYDAQTGQLSFRIQNQTGHKLISGFPMGRRMFVNVRVYQGGNLVHEINPYDTVASTLRGLPHPSSPPLANGQSYVDALVYEVLSSSTLTGETRTFHLSLATGRYKDNRIPPKGYRIGEAAARLSEPVVAGQSAPNLYTAAEYLGGYDDVAINVPAGADGVKIRVLYQTTSREYVEFLADELDGTATTLSSPTPSGEANAYIAQTDPFFSALKAWGSTIQQLWEHNRALPGAAPVLVAATNLGTVPGGCVGPSSNGMPCDDGSACTVNDVCQAGLCGGSPLACPPPAACQLAGVCEPSMGACTYATAADGAACPGGSCVGGACIPSATTSAGAGGAGGSGGAAGMGGMSAGGTGGSAGVGMGGQAGMGGQPSPSPGAGPATTSGAGGAGGGAGGDDAAAEGCACTAAGDTRANRAGGLALLGAAIAFARRRRARGR
jgi:MYXO-CTERM domain-containing protein